MLCEVLYRIGASASWVDGDPVEVRPAGVFVTEAEFAAWLAGTEPTSIATLRPQRAARMRSFLQRIKTLIADDFDAEQIAAASSIETDEVELQRRDALAIRDKIALMGGVDSTWGFEELRKMSVMIADLSLDEIDEMTSTVEEIPQGAVNPVLVRRRPAFVDYRTLLSGGSIDDILDPEILVVPARGETPFDFATLLTDP